MPSPPNPAITLPSATPKTAAHFLIPAIVLLFTAITFSGVIHLEWLNWDDDLYVYENEMVKAGDYAAIFQNPVAGNYNPLPIATHAWEWQQVGDWAWLYHFNNLWLHLLCTVLVYVLMLRLGLKPIWAGFAALLFGIHPMHVESVAWVTERKDVLFGMFYVAALIAYMHCLRGRVNARSGSGAQSSEPAYSSLLMLRFAPVDMTWLGITFVLFALALLSKIQAVSLPLSMLAIDFYQRRKGGMRLIWEKVPFFVGSAVIGVVGWMALKEQGALGFDDGLGWFGRMVLGLSSFSIYVIKAVVPFEMSLLYPYPEELTVWHYAGMAGAIAMLAGAIALRNKARALTFGLVFFLVNIVFVLQIVGAGNAFLADRFSYIPYIGLFFALAMGGQWLASHQPSLRIVAGGIVAVMAFTYATIAFQYIPAWKNSETIWTDVIAKYPRQLVFSYINRGEYRHSNQIGDHGFSDFNTAIELQPRNYMGYLHRGDIYFQREENEKALADYTRVLELLGQSSPGKADKWSPSDVIRASNSTIAQTLGSRGAIFARQGRFSNALNDLNRAIYLYPYDPNILNNRALTYLAMGNPGKAIADFTAAISLDPQNAGYYYFRSQAYAKIDDREAAQADAQKAHELGIK